MSNKKYDKCTYVAKGQVWMVNEDTRLTNFKMRTHSRLMAKTRPHLILSPEDDWGIITAIPITSKLSYRGAIDLTYKGIDGTTEQLRMSQITSIEKKSLFEYMYTIPESLMNDVDKVIIEKLCLGEHINQTHTYMEKMDNKTENIDVSCTELTNESNERERGSENKHKNDQKPKDNDCCVYPIHKKNERWTESIMKQFLNDVTILPKDILLKKYTLTEKYMRKIYRQIFMKMNPNTQPPKI